MNNLVSTLETFWGPRVLSILRIFSGLLMMQHGASKLFGYLSTKPGPLAEVGSMIWVAGVLEFFVAGMLALGLFTRSCAFLLSGLMAVAYFMSHAPGGFWPILNKGELAVLYCWVYFYLFAAGGGPWSLDALISREPAAKAA